MLLFSQEVFQHLRSCASSGRTHYTQVINYLESHIPDEVRGNIESLMTLLVSGNPWLKDEEAVLRRSLFATVSRTVADVLRDAEKVAGNQDCPKYVEDLIKYWNSTRSTLVSFNYDTLVEKYALDIIEPEEHEGLSTSSFYEGPFTNLGSRTDLFGNGPIVFNRMRIIKLHGSLNWYYSGNEDFSGEPIYADPSDDRDPETSPIFERNRQDLAPLIIPPLLDKDSFIKHSLLRLQWKEAFSSMIHAKDIYVIGYSLPDTDLTAKFMIQTVKKFTKAKWHVLLFHADASIVTQRFKGVLGQCEFLLVEEGKSSAELLSRYVTLRK